MAFGSVLWLLALYGFCSNGIHAKQWFVSRLDGISSINCGLKASSPCRTIQQVTARARDGDIINIDGAGTSRDPYICENEKGLGLPGLVMRSYNTRAFISCKTNGFRFLCNSTTNASQGVSLKGITFTNTSLYLVDCFLKVSDCSFTNNSAIVLSLNLVRDSIENVLLDGCTFQNSSGSSLKIYGGSVNLNIADTSFTFNKLYSAEETILVISSPNVQKQQGNVAVNFTNITVSQNSCHGQACFELAAGLNGAKLVLAVKGGLIANNAAAQSIFEIHGFSNAYVEFESTDFRKNAGRAINICNGNSVELSLVNTVFSENRASRVDGGAFFVSGFPGEAVVSLFGSNFSSNKATNGGACAFVNISSLMLNIENCQFVRNEAWSSGGAIAVGRNYSLLHEAAIDVRGSNFSGNILHFVVYMPRNSKRAPFNYEADYWSKDRGGGGALALYVFNIERLSLRNNIFADNQAQEKDSGAIRAQLGTLHTDAEFLNCEFLRNSGCLKSGTLQLTVRSPNFQPRVILQNVTFVENSGDSLSDIYLFQNRLLMRSCKMQNNSGGGVYFGTYLNSLDILMEDTLFNENINFQYNIYERPYTNGSVYQLKNVSFVNNTSNAKGSIFQISMYHSQSVFSLQRSTFFNNFCKSGVVKISVKPSLVYKNTRVIINNTKFRDNSGVAESTLTIIDVNVITIQNSKFFNNFGSTDGSHVRVQMRSSELTIHKTTFYQSKPSQVFNKAREQPYNGFLKVSSFGNVTIRDSSFISDPFTEGKSLIFVEGARRVVMDHSVRVKAPLSTKLHLHNFTHWEVESNFYPSLITSFSLSTEPCPMGTYSIHRGSSKGFTLEDSVKCHSCPNGGNCSSSLAARPNFWGYPIGDKVRFKLCPEGYCCPYINQKCSYHNTSYQHSGCQGDRTGILCGQCKKDFSEGLFSTQCLPVRDCNHHWFFVILIILTTSFALYLIKKPPVYETLMKNLTWFLPSHKEDDYKYYCKMDDENKAKACSKYGVLKSLFYFYQVAGVLTASSYGVRYLLKDSIVLPVTRLLDFQISVNNDWKICPMPGITPLSKTLFQLAAVTAIFFSIPVIYLLHSGLNKLRRRNPTLPQCGPYLGAVLEIVLLGYSAMTGTAMRLLHCVPIQHVSRWYYDAQITCLQWWQSAAFLVIALYLLPFILTLYFASLRLNQGKICGKTFLLACVFPFPYLLFVFIVYVNKVTTQRYDCQEMTSTISANYHEDNDTSHPPTIEHSLLEVLSGPFSKPQDHQSSGKIYWESILIGRRFVIILTGSFLEHAYLRSVCLTILCLVFLLHHIYHKPFAQFRSNVAETVCLATLVVIAILNVGVASYYSAGIEAHGVNQQYVRYFLLTEAVLLGIIPFVCAVFVSLSLVLQFVRLAVILIQAIRERWPVSRPKYHTQLSLLNQDEPLLGTT